MRRHFTILAMLIGIAVGWYLWRRHVLTPESRPTSGLTAGSAGSGASAASAIAKSRPVRQVTPEERRHFVEQIVAARAVRESHAAGAAAESSGGTTTPPPALPDDDHTHDLDRLDPAMLGALDAAIPFLASCYEQQAPAAATPGKTAAAMITLTNDPDIGAVIDADQILDEHGGPLDPKVDACLRSTLQTLELPPLQAGDTVKLQYSFRFGDKPAGLGATVDLKGSGSP